MSETSSSRGEAAEIPFPDFFLVGAPRCGTSALTRWLKKHPEICFSKPKEPHYFTKLEPLIPAADVRIHYLERFFRQWDPRVHRVSGEGSVSTLYSPEAIRRILALNPDARFLVVVRSPLEMLPSFHALMLYYLEEDVRNFEEAWRLQAVRAQGRAIPRRCLDPRLLQYAEMASLGRHVDQLFATAGREHCHAIVFDDLAQEPQRVYRDVTRFLGVDDRFVPDLEHRNESRHYRMAWLHQLLYRPPLVDPMKLTSFLDSRERQGKKPWIARQRKKLIEWNTYPRRPDPLSPELREEIHTRLGPEIERLGKLLDRDLSGWR